MSEPAWFRSHLARALDLLRRELPRAYRRVVDELGGREVGLRIGAEEVSVRFVEGLPVLGRSGGAPRVILATEAREILALADAERSVLGAILEDRVLLRGALPDLLAFHDALHVFLHGAVRCPSFDQLLDEFRASCPAPLEAPAAASQRLAGHLAKASP